ncbi:hypothetical protein KY329_04800 [Candidatus Woesearchaeota archaeon]|nr:hypothetical protein [Candidatus Woesearchaeota archaeon]
MKDKVLFNGAILAILVVGLVGTLGMVNSMTGALVQNTSNPDSYKCVCQRHEFDSRGNLISFNEWEQRVKRSSWNDLYCENLCATRATSGLLKASRNVNIIGYAKPRGMETADNPHFIRTV